MAASMNTETLRRGLATVGSRLRGDDGSPAEMGAHPTVHIEPLNADDREAATEVLTRAFRPERLTTAAFCGNGEREQAGLRAFVGALLRAAFAHNQPLLVARERDRQGRAGDVVGVVICYRPGFDVTTGMVLRQVSSRPREAVGLLQVLDRHDTRRVLQLHEAPAGMRERNHTLEYIGVRPDRQGEGIGGRLLDATHEFTDADPGSGGTYLATGGEYTRDIYADYGYEVVDARVDERLQVDSEPVHAWHMHRPTD
jgi:GNAT superfamily N-acetyltransferase